MSDEMKNMAVKVAGDWELDVLAIPFESVDSDGQYFDENTDLMDSVFKTPAVVYYHGITPDRKNVQADIEVIGQVTKREKRADGVWVRVVLDKAKEYAKRIWEAAKNGMAAASSGSISHLARLEGRPYDKQRPGRISSWAFAELSLIDVGEGRAPANRHAVALPALKAVYEQAGIELPELQDEPNQPQADISAESEGVKTHKQEIKKMDKEVKEVVGLTPEQVQAQIDAALKAQAENAAKAAEAQKAEQERIDAEVEKKMEAFKAEQAKARRLPSDGQAPYATKFGGVGKYDNLSLDDQAFLVGLLQSAKAGGRSSGISETALKALAIKAAEHKGRDESDERVGVVSRNAMKAAGVALKADEVMQQDLTSYGDEWVGVAYSQSLWEAIRVNTFVLGKLPSIEVPAGHESVIIPIESTDAVFYKVAETTDHNATTLFPNASVTSSQIGTGKVTLSLSKLGARVPWSGELEEDSLIPFVAQLRAQLVKAGAEYLESAIIDGDTTVTATTNINSIAATGALSGTQHYMLFNGLRKSPLVTTTANSRSAGGSLSVDDYLATVQLMGGAGINALDRSKVGFIIDPNTHYATLKLPEVKTRDSFSSPTIEGGMVANIWGYPVFVSGSMHKMSSVRKANSAGKIDQNTVANNAYGAILAARWDQWLVGFRRRMTMEVTRYPRSDSNEITLLTRLGLIQRDTEASAITYYVGV